MGEAGVLSARVRVINIVQLISHVFATPWTAACQASSVLHRLPELAQTYQGVIPVSGFGIKREILIYHEEIQVCFLFVFVFLKVI